jgi:glycosyltransferase involved in cell wall biosynthesis
MRPHLCFVNSLRSWGGAEVWFLETALALQERGHLVSLVCQPGGQLGARAQAAGLRVQAVPIRIDAAPWTWIKLARYFRQAGVSALFCNLDKDFKAASVAARLAGVPQVLVSRESDFPLKDKWYYRWYYNQLATAVIVNSEATRSTTLESAPWLDPVRTKLLYKGIDVKRFRPAAASPAEPTVGFMGQLIKRKGVDTLMRAWQLVEEHPWPRPVRLKIAGTGPLAGWLAEWRQNLQHPEKVILCGQVEDTPAFYRDLTVLAMPSRAEGFGLVAAEAGACGLPVVASGVSSLPEIVAHRETGLLVPPGDEGHLAAALTELLDRPETALSLGTAARERVIRMFNKEQTLDELVQLTGLG